MSTKNATSHKDMANAIRALSMDAIERANSGHPGLPMGEADVTTVLYSQFLKHKPSDPKWQDRDRFVLSAGHGSMLLYSLLYLNGYPEIDIDAIKDFRQLGAKTAGHPEYGYLPGIETTTGPLGQGIANAVGMALAERLMAARFGDDVVDHRTYALVGDGCLMEGISQEAISFAGHLALGKLVVLFDDNGISIDGPTSITTSEDHLARFSANNWHVQAVDGHDAEAVAAAITAAKASDKPSFIACKTTIGYGSPNKGGTSGVHGAPLGKDEIELARKTLGWEHGAFEIPAPVLDAWRQSSSRCCDDYAKWESAVAAMPQDQAAEYKRLASGELPANWTQSITDFKRKLAADKPKWASRKSSQEVLEVLAPAIPEMIGGSADLTGSNNTKAGAMEPISAGEFGGRYVYYGIREHGMAAVMNGMCLHGGVIPYGGTFFVFTDYCRPAIRMSALMGLKVVYVMTHDSIGLGEDGPTHQPVEHLASLRAMPGLKVFRPADATETAECWQLAIENNGPSVIVLSRQGLPPVRHDFEEKNLCGAGAYEVASASGDAKVTLLSTGSEVDLAIAAKKLLDDDGVAARVVSMPCWELFEELSADDKKVVLGEGTVRVAVEAACGFGWERYIGDGGQFVGMKGFGASAPAPALYEKFGITAAAVAAAAKASL